MTIVEGKVETLKELNRALRRSGVSRFNSVGELTKFQREFETEKSLLPERIEQAVAKEIHDSQATLNKAQEAHKELRKQVRADQEQKILQLKEGVARARRKGAERSVFRFFFSLRASSLSRKAARLERNLKKTVEKKTCGLKKTVARQSADVDNLRKNKESLTSQRYELSLRDLNHTKEVVDGLYTLVAGAIGETSVVRALRELSDDYYLINDFSVKFNPPIYNKAESDRIYSVQIDHLLIGRSGIFLLETKNWSRSSVQNLDLRSPVEQVKRTGFALFVMLNSDAGEKSLKLARHHWGAKKIPIRNVIVMTNEKPREEFKYVKVLSLSELVGYIEYFNQTFSDDEVRIIFEFLKKKS
ncbi:MAG: NERD domain-containing protein [Gammaproteobacteria bacterium]|nr:NERD domain-containing protein [Gammaproteobacteria bacterium]